MSRQNTQPLIEYVRRFNNFNIAVIGDLMIDKYIWGRATRISQEAPVPVVCVEHQNAVPGGAANVARNLLSLTAHTETYGVIGQDADGAQLADLLKSAGAVVSGGIVHPMRSTTVKTRVIAGNQQVVRIDLEDTRPLEDNYQAQVLEHLEQNLKAGQLNAIILEDYAKGVFTREFMQQVTNLGAKHHIPVTLDPHPTHPFNVKKLKLMTPNRQEAFALAGMSYTLGIGNPCEDKPLLEVGKKLHKLWNPELLLITLGGEGMALFQGDDPVPQHIPTQARQVFDVSGAGDTVMATMTLALLTGASPFDAALIANYAAGVVVGLVGTAPIQYDTLVQKLDNNII